MQKMFKYEEKRLKELLVKQLVAFSKHIAWMDDENKIVEKKNIIKKKSEVKNCRIFAYVLYST